jgi:hypothetical protein
MAVSFSPDVEAAAGARGRPASAHIAFAAATILFAFLAALGAH